MKHIYTWAVALVAGHSTFAQQISINSGAQVVIHAGTQFAGNGLRLMPSTSLTLTGASLDRSSTVTNAFGNPYVSRVYRFTPSPPSFTGNIQFSYDDSELNGLTESGLQLIVYNETAWQVAGSSVVDETANTVDATGINNLSLGELILAGSISLPLRWGTVSASRTQEAVQVRWTTEQEHQVSHFDVERSTDGVHWTTAIAHIPAANQTTVRQYQQTDHLNYSGLLHYRIRQTDLDGRHTLSKIISVAATPVRSPLTIQPNPASSHFTLTGVSTRDIVTLELYTAGGALLKTWKGYQATYYLPTINAGTYYIRVHLVNGTTESRQLIVK